MDLATVKIEVDRWGHMAYLVYREDRTNALSTVLIRPGATIAMAKLSKPVQAASIEPKPTTTVRAISPISTILNLKDKRIKNGKFIGQKAKRREELKKIKYCKLCNGEFSGRGNKLYDTIKCRQIAWMNNNPDYILLAQMKNKGPKNDR